MGWLRLVGCLKIYVSLQNIGLFCRALLQKRPIFLSILLIVATPYVTRSKHTQLKRQNAVVGAVCARVSSRDTIAFKFVAFIQIIHVQIYAYRQDAVACAACARTDGSLTKSRLFVTYTVYGVATIDRLLKMIGLFCKRAL